MKVERVIKNVNHKTFFVKTKYAILSCVKHNLDIYKPLCMIKSAGLTNSISEDILFK